MGSHVFRPDSVPYPRIHSLVCSYTFRSLHVWSIVLHEFASSAPLGMRVVRERGDIQQRTFQAPQEDKRQWSISWWFLPYVTSSPVRPNEDHSSTPGDLVFQCPVQDLCHKVLSWCGVISSGVAGQFLFPFKVSDLLSFSSRYLACSLAERCRGHLLGPVERVCGFPHLGGEPPPGASLPWHSDVGHVRERASSK